MKRALVAATVLLLTLGAQRFLTGCNRYAENDLELLPKFTSKSMCSCLFVMKQTETFCRDWTRVDPNVKSISIDYERKIVETETLALWGGKARWLDKKRGCVLE
jgi:hypothetical protein